MLQYIAHQSKRVASRRRARRVIPLIASEAAANPSRRWLSPSRRQPWRGWRIFRGGSRAAGARYPAYVAIPFARATGVFFRSYGENKTWRGTEVMKSNVGDMRLLTGSQPS